MENEGVDMLEKWCRAATANKVRRRGVMNTIAHSLLDLK